MDGEDRKWADSLPSSVIPNGTQVSAQEQYSLPRGLEGLPDILWKQVPSSLQAGITQEVGQRVTSLGAGLELPTEPCRCLAYKAGTMGLRL